MKAFKLIITFRFLAILDVMFAEKFVLTTYRDGRQNSKTKFSRKEIKEKIK